VKLLLDQGTPRSTAALLRSAGFDAVHTAEIEMAAAADNDILSRARQEDRVVVTLDADFHMILALSKAGKPSVIRVRIEGLGARELNDLVQEVIRRCVPDLEDGALVSVQEGRIRIRRLPMV
jgi:predicted nuclease of predicted toxin-antitoxin system